MSATLRVRLALALLLMPLAATAGVHAGSLFDPLPTGPPPLPGTPENVTEGVDEAATGTDELTPDPNPPQPPEPDPSVSAEAASDMTETFSGLRAGRDGRPRQVPLRRRTARGPAVGPVPCLRRRRTDPGIGAPRRPHSQPL